jgi:hypothetical protein
MIESVLTLVFIMVIYEYNKNIFDSIKKYTFDLLNFIINTIKGVTNTRFDNVQRFDNVHHFDKPEDIVINNKKNNNVIKTNDIKYDEKEIINNLFVKNDAWTSNQKWSDKLKNYPATDNPSVTMPVVSQNANPIVQNVTKIPST